MVLFPRAERTHTLKRARTTGEFVLAAARSGPQAKAVLHSKPVIRCATCVPAFRADHVRDSGASVKPRLIVEPAVGPLKQLFRFVTLPDAGL
jgi:hypothetical protein